MRTIAATAVAFALLCTASASAQTTPIREPVVAVKKVTRVVRLENAEGKRAEAQLRKAARQVGALRKMTWDCQDTLGVERTRAATSVWALPRSVAYRTKFVAAKWVKLAKGCQARLQQRTIPTTGDWVTAVKLVQRIYPGTADWLLYISKREGGYGGFVMNHQGSGAGGWMQFMASTFYAHNNDAFADARRRGFILSESANSWQHPLGQAITAGYMRFTHQDGCHWCL